MGLLFKLLIFLHLSVLISIRENVIDKRYLWSSLFKSVEVLIPENLRTTALCCLSRNVKLWKEILNSVQLKYIPCKTRNSIRGVT